MFLRASPGRGRTQASELNPRILRNDLGHPRHHERYRAVIVALAQKWNGFAAEAAYFAIRQNRLQPVADLDSVPVVLRSNQDQHATIL